MTDSTQVHSNWTYHNPVKVRAGSGIIKLLPELVSSGLWLLVTSQGFTRRGMTAKLQELMPATTRLWVHDQVSPNPELDDLEALTVKLKKEQLQGVLALGGGSVIDAAKVLAVTLLSQAQKPLTATLRQGEPQNWKERLPLIAIPTTSGTGAEVTPFATVWDQANHKKHSVTGDEVCPTIALLDPELTLSLPYEETAYTGLDAISHALESLWNKNKSPVSEAYAWQALELANEALPAVLEEPGNLVKREKMQQASLLAGLAISQTRTAIAHSISYPLTIYFGMPHGLACSFTLPLLIQLALEQGIFERYRKPLIVSLQAFLHKLDMPKKVHSYLDCDQLLNHLAAMNTPGRADNCLIARLDLKKLLQKSIS